MSRLISRIIIRMATRVNRRYYNVITGNSAAGTQASLIPAPNLPIMIKGIPGAPALMERAPDVLTRYNARGAC